MRRILCWLGLHNYSQSKSTLVYCGFCQHLSVKRSLDQLFADGKTPEELGIPTNRRIGTFTEKKP